MSTLTLTERDSGKSIEVKQDDIIIVKLAENPTTGYRWAIDSTDDQIITVQDDDYTAENDGIGGGGTRTFTLKAVDQGTASFRLKLWREWEGDPSVTRRFEVHLRIV